jgi:hypothetical protein
MSDSGRMGVGIREKYRDIYEEEGRGKFRFERATAEG